MIKTILGKTNIEGNYPSIAADYTCITRAVHKFFVNKMEMGEKEAWGKIDGLVENAKRDMDEKTSDDELDKLLSELSDLLFKRMAGDSSDI